MAEENNNLELDEIKSDPTVKDSNAVEEQIINSLDDLPSSGADLEALYDVPVQVSAVLGKSTIQVSELLKLGKGVVLELDRKIGEPIDIYVNDRLVARGEVVIVENKLGITMVEIIKTDAK